jgi:hypothetical protein
MCHSLNAVFFFFSFLSKGKKKKKKILSRRLKCHFKELTLSMSLRKSEATREEKKRKMKELPPQPRCFFFILVFFFPPACCYFRVFSRWKIGIEKKFDLFTVQTSREAFFGEKTQSGVFALSKKQRETIQKKYFSF